MTKLQLHEVAVRNPQSADVIALLWEIKRLRSIVLRADQLQRALGEVGGAKGLILGGLRDALDGEPCVAEFPRLDTDR